MLYSIFVIGVVIVGLVLIATAFYMLLPPRWLQGWLRGNLGFLCLALAFFLILSVLDLLSYKTLSSEQTIATISFKNIAPQKFLATLVDADGRESEYNIFGDQWQLDVRLFKWHADAAALGLAPVYRLDRISGRYLSLEQEQASPRSVFAVRQAQSALDLWSVLHEYRDIIPWLDVTYGNATYLPMADGALFLVTLSPSGLVPRPLNDRAKSAISQWQVTP